MPKQKYPSIEKWKMNCQNTWNNWVFNKSLPVVLLDPIKKIFALGWGLVLNLIPQKKKRKRKRKAEELQVILIICCWFYKELEIKKW